jgi:hypothetical protein
MCQSVNLGWRWLIVVFIVVSTSLDELGHHLHELRLSCGQLLDNIEAASEVVLAWVNNLTD